MNKLAFTMNPAALAIMQSFGFRESAPVNRLPPLRAKLLEVVKACAFFAAPPRVGAQLGVQFIVKKIIYRVFILLHACGDSSFPFELPETAESFRKYGNSRTKLHLLVHADPQPTVGGRGGRFVSASIGSCARPMSENTVNAARVAGGGIR